MDEKRLAYLRAVGAHSGEWTWYQLDRSLSARDVRLVDGMTAILAALVAEGLLETESRGGHEYYALTERGKRVLADAERR